MRNILAALEDRLHALICLFYFSHVSLELSPLSTAPESRVCFTGGSDSTSIPKITQQIGQQAVSNDPICNKSRMRICSLSYFFVKKLIDRTFVLNLS